MGDPKGLLLDVGGVVIRTPFEMLAPTERRLGLTAGALGPRGPFDPDGDAAFARVRDGTLGEREYWRRRAREAAPTLGSEPTPRALFRILFDADEDEVVRPAVRALIRSERRAGRPVGLLTNDLEDFHGPGWVGRMGVFDAVDVLVDASRTGVLKPDPEAFRLGVEAMGMAAGRLVFVDDQPVNVAAAADFGLHAVPFDPTDVDGSLAHVRSALG